MKTKLGSPIAGIIFLIYGLITSKPIFIGLGLVCFIVWITRKK